MDFQLMVLNKVGTEAQKERWLRLFDHSPLGTVSAQLKRFSD